MEVPHRLLSVCISAGSIHTAQYLWNFSGCCSSWALRKASSEMKPLTKDFNGTPAASAAAACAATSAAAAASAVAAAAGLPALREKCRKATNRRVNCSPKDPFRIRSAVKLLSLFLWGIDSQILHQRVVSTSSLTFRPRLFRLGHVLFNNKKLYIVVWKDAIELSVPVGSGARRSRVSCQA